MNKLPVIDSDIKALIMIREMARTAKEIEQLNNISIGLGSFLFPFMYACIERLREYREATEKQADTHEEGS